MKSMVYRSRPLVEPLRTGRHPQNQTHSLGESVVTFVSSLGGLALSLVVTVFAVANHYTSLSAALLRLNFERFSLPDDSFLGPLWAAVGMNVTLAQSTAALLAGVNALGLFLLVHLVTGLIHALPAQVGPGLSLRAAAYHHRTELFFLALLLPLVSTAVLWDIGLQTYLWLTNFLHLDELPFGEIPMAVPHLDAVRKAHPDLLAFGDIRIAQAGYTSVLLLVAVALEIAIYYVAKSWQAVTGPRRVAAEADAAAFARGDVGVRDLLAPQRVIGTQEETTAARAIVNDSLDYDPETDRVWDRDFRARLRALPPRVKAATLKGVAVLLICIGLGGAAFPPVTDAAQADTHVVAVLDTTATYAAKRDQARELLLDFLQRLAATADIKTDPRAAGAHTPRVTIVALDAFSEVVFDGRAADLKSKDAGYWKRLFDGRREYATCSDVLGAFELVRERLQSDDGCTTKLVVAFTDFRHEPPDPKGKARCLRATAPVDRFPFDGLRDAFTQAFFVPRADVAVWKPAIDERGLSDNFRLFADAGPEVKIPLPPKARACAPDLGGAARSALVYALGGAALLVAALWVAARPSSAPPPPLRSSNRRASRRPR